MLVYGLTFTSMDVRFRSQHKMMYLYVLKVVEAVVCQGHSVTIKCPRSSL